MRSFVLPLTKVGDGSSMVHKVKQFLDHQFNNRDLGNLKYFLRFGITRSKFGIHISQIKYALYSILD